MIYGSVITGALSVAAPTPPPAMGLKAAPVDEAAPAWPSRKAAIAKKTLQPKAGIVVKTVQAWRGVDSTDRVFINCVSHMAIEEPMYMQNPVDDDYLDTKGFESLRVRVLSFFLSLSLSLSFALRPCRPLGAALGQCVISLTC